MPLQASGKPDPSQDVAHLLRSPAPHRVSGSMVAAKKVSLPVYLSQSPQPALLIRFDEFSVEKKQKGFLKFGAWRVPTIEGLELQFFDSSEAALAMEKAHEMVHSLGGRSSIEFRRVRFLVTGEPEISLEAGRGEWTKGMGWRLSKGVTLRTSKDETIASKAFLRIAPDEMGALFLSGPDFSLNTNLFQIAQPSQQHPNKSPQ